MSRRSKNRKTTQENKEWKRETSSEWRKSLHDQISYNILSFEFELESEMERERERQKEETITIVLKHIALELDFDFVFQPSFLIATAIMIHMTFSSIIIINYHRLCSLSFDSIIKQLPTDCDILRLLQQLISLTCESLCDGNVNDTN